MKAPKVLVWDIETSHTVLAKFSLYPEYTSPKNILKDWYIISGSWKWLGKKKVYNTLKNTTIGNFEDDESVVAALSDIVQEADLLVHHNGDKFDLKKLNTRIIKHKLPPMKNKPLTIDTLKEAKKHFAFTSNKLDYLGEFLGVGSKIVTPPNLWIDVLNNDIKALKTMVKYGDGDVVLEEAVYLEMKPYIDHPNLSWRVITKDCPNCESTNVQCRGFRMTRLGIKYQRYHCQDCGAWSSARKSEKEKSLLR